MSHVERHLVQFHSCLVFSRVMSLSVHLYANLLILGHCIWWCWHDILGNKITYPFVSWLKGMDCFIFGIITQRLISYCLTGLFLFQVHLHLTQDQTSANTWACIKQGAKAQYWSNREAIFIALILNSRWTGAGARSHANMPLLLLLCSRTWARSIAVISTTSASSGGRAEKREEEDGERERGGRHTG